MNTETNPKDWIDAKGRKVPDRLVSDVDKLKQQTIDKVVDYAVELSEQIARFKGHTFDDVYSLLDLLKQEYGAKIGGKKGNIDLVGFDGCRKVQITVADHITFGPELQVAKTLIDEYIDEVIEGSSDEIRVLVTHAFETDKPGHVNREALFSLRRLNITHPKWISAMQAITDSMQVVGSKAYARAYQRDTSDSAWEMIPLNIAGV